MARLRTLKPEFFTHEVLGELSPLHRLLFQGLWCHADREGRLEDRPRFLKTVILPYDECSVDALLADLASRGFIVRYEAGGKRVIFIPAFRKHQQPHMREKGSILLPPPEQVPENTRAVPSTVLSPCHPEAEHMPSPSVFGLGGIGLGLVLGEDSRGEHAAAPQAPGGQKGLFDSPEPTSPSGQAKPSAEVLQELWNSHPGLPRWREMPAGRRKSALVRLREREVEGPGGWREAVERIASSAFCRGENDRGWRADPDWLLRPGTAAKVLEGKYDGKAPGATGRPKDVKRGWFNAADSQAAHATAPVGKMKDF